MRQIFVERNFCIYKVYKYIDTFFDIEKVENCNNKSKTIISLNCDVAFQNGNVIQSLMATKFCILKDDDAKT